LEAKTAVWQGWIILRFRKHAVVSIEVDTMWKGPPVAKFEGLSLGKEKFGLNISRWPSLHEHIIEVLDAPKDCRVICK